jgi:hypothetical protein
MTHPEFDPEYVFTHHATTPEKVVRYDAIHAAAKRFAEAILAHAPSSDDRRAALQLVREATMMANAAVALDGRLR